ncbi:uncharacterized protein TIGR03905 [Peptoclostridium litorale DSM 5388]|uniref:ribonucleoside-diphosphate reductase n=1 Tax=Peptoclostridium litorale DSM 5388 TaxID=1121324 RepID=A0A069RHW5_PEPLI|nr:TIGR03905 family TSCPD domain-containing protein [Peptoclostridium litorale]KDR93857.1 hypothetical protein CLIT_23c01290 [Peptoclostridium litorale DSM 5388]KDR95284.1 hypothetical protein CLIT_10c00110 [Peptoclostridium litorale DSM 5388]SIN87248.1 uncharacterized protein TIGR03905 [Peptoclostridium litorale DSM 5388]
MFTFKTSGTCAREIQFKIENGILADISFCGGCDGNLKGISSLCQGMKIEDVIERLSGITCGSKNTSCPDQLSKALSQYIIENQISA